MTTILLRGRTTSGWLADDPVIDRREPVVELDDATEIAVGLKIGDGVRPWSELENITFGDALVAVATSDGSTVNFSGDGTSGSPLTAEVQNLSPASIGVTASAAELNVTDGLTASTAELNVLDGITATTAELNHTDGVTSPIQTQIDAKAPNARTITGTGNLTGGGDLSANRTLDMADMAEARIKGRAAGAGTGTPTDLTPTQARLAMSVYSSDEVETLIDALDGVIQAGSLVIVSGGDSASFDTEGIKLPLAASDDDPFSTVGWYSDPETDPEVEMFAYDDGGGSKLLIQRSDSLIGLVAGLRSTDAGAAKVLALRNTSGTGTARLYSYDSGGSEETVVQVDDDCTISVAGTTRLAVTSAGAAVTGTLGATGAVDFDSTLNVDGTATVENLTVDQDATIGDDLTVTGSLTLTGQPRCKVTHSTTQSLGTSGTSAVLVFDTEAYDVGGFHVTSVTHDRLTIPTGEGGLYLVGATINFAANATGRRGAILTLNGAAIDGGQVHTLASGGATVTTVNVTTEVVCAAGDILRVEGVQNSGGALNVATAATAFWCRRVA